MTGKECSMLEQFWFFDYCMLQYGWDCSQGGYTKGEDHPKEAIGRPVTEYLFQEERSGVLCEAARYCPHIIYDPCDRRCAGEIGQVGKSTYLHGFTAAVGILRETIEVEEQPQPPMQQEQPQRPPEGQ